MESTSERDTLFDCKSKYSVEWKEESKVIDIQVTNIDEIVDGISKNLSQSDWQYLKEHPEVRAIIRSIVTSAIKKKPKNIYQFTAELFQCNNHSKLCSMINKQLKWIKQQDKAGTWTPPDGELHFSTSSSKSSVFGKKCEEPLWKKDANDSQHMAKNKLGESYMPNC